MKFSILYTLPMVIILTTAMFRMMWKSMFYFTEQCVWQILIVCCKVLMFWIFLLLIKGLCYLITDTMLLGVAVYKTLQQDRRELSWMGNKYLFLDEYVVQWNAFVSGVQLVLCHGRLNLFSLFCLENCSMFNLPHLLLPDIFLLVLIYANLWKLYSLLMYLEWKYVPFWNDSRF